MRYPQGGGLTPERQAFRERIRMEAVERFAADVPNGEIAKELRVSVRSVQRWRRAWQDSSSEGLWSVGPVSRPKLSDTLFAVLDAELAKGPVVHGWPDQTWTLARIKTLIGRRFHKSFSLSGVSQMLRRHGWSHNVPARRAVERDEAAVAGWVKETWPSVEAPRRRSALTSSSRTRPGFSMTPPTTRTWSRRGTTPIVRVRGRSQRRISIAALACYKAGERSRLIYRPVVHPDHKAGGRRSFAWTDYRDLLVVAHRQLGKPIVLVWDNLNVHRDRRLREFIDAQDWITVHFLLPYAPQLNPVEGIWSLLRRRCQANTALTDPTHLMRALRQSLRRVQYRPGLIDGCLAGTGLTMSSQEHSL
ncbi:IS630 family transposase [Streptomyces sp. NBC_01340]|uniref:IS630 family transposase n=2 Tax=Streptomyces TaxID=1883 RepID=UPI003DA64BC2